MKQLDDWLLLLNQDRKRGAASATYGEGWIREDGPDSSTVLWSDLNAESADKAIATQIDFARATGRPLEWKLYDYDSPSDLGTRLKAAGFRPGPAETVLVISLEDALSWSVVGEFEVRTCQSEEDIDAYRRVAESVFEKNYQQTSDALRRELRAGENHHVGFLCFDGSTPVGCARLYPNLGYKFAGLYGGGVLKSHRGLGCYRALLSARARYASAAGSKNLLIDALPTSQPIVEKLGFHTVARTTPYDLAF